ncbi:hypothetical protein H2198_006680 [Neophaeococcomyces mojaviensis]|uniref:Uncharacterized protein n=1 Tax=Neophaeococcomyces mojaviensis TaxID=3383035 RepID=A0ACC3A288_9EURO|nr:hypothetical protein H2198_006680 [Knufia sp. JES_112]
MDSVLVEQYYSQEMAQKAFTHMSMFGRRTNVPRPLSEATLILDTDDEDDLDSQPSSLVFDSDSQSTLSSRDGLKTPSTAGLGGFDFHFDPNPVKGPNGPHLFRAASTDSSEGILSLSPIPTSKPQTRRVTSLNAAVAQLNETQVRSWSPRQVADWMAEAGFEPAVVEKFLIHDIYGSVLLDLQFEDLKEIDISSFGKRRQVMSTIQLLRSSSMISAETPAPINSSPEKQLQSLSRAPRPEEAHMVTTKRATSRRRRQGRRSDDILPAESVSIVAIEQVLPEAHTCWKGENCIKWQKQQRKIEKIKQDFAHEFDHAETKSTVAVSTVGSSDVLGPASAAPTLTAERLNSVEPRDPQESVRQFLDFQNTHIAKNPSPPPAPSALFAVKSNNLLQGLPKLTIPMPVVQANSPDRTPISALRNPTQVQAQLKAALRDDPYHYGGVASPVDVYRVDTPMSATDIPVTAIPIDPCQRDVSQSVPPEMRYGNTSTFVADPIQRSNSTQPASRRRQYSFVPSITPVREVEDNLATARPPVVTSEVNLANHAGWMRKREKTHMLKHEWQDHYFKLNGTKLNMHDTDRASLVLDSLDVDEYNVHAYTTASGSKLQAAFKKSIGSGSKEPSFAFTLIPEDQKEKRVFSKSGNHHFAVNSGRDRVEWMRKIMLAKALKKNEPQDF